MSGVADPMPSRKLVAVWLAAAFAALLCAFVALLLQPGWASGFFYSERAVLAAHLVGLGFVTCTILGATYLVLPLALRSPISTNRWDAIACGTFLLGASGVLSHFWLNDVPGVGWSGLLVLPAVLFFAARFSGALARGKAPRYARAFVRLAYGNLFLAASLGTLLAFDKGHSILRTDHLTCVFGHAHIALAGWAAMMVAGVGYRLLPMVFPAAPPTGRSPWVCLALLEAGAVGVGTSFFLAPPAARFFGAVLAAGLLVFLADVVRMRTHKRPPPARRKRPDLATIHALSALGYLAAAVVLGLFLLFTTPWHFGLVSVYAVFVLIGFLAQIAIGAGMRLFPMAAYAQIYQESAFREIPRAPDDRSSRTLQWMVFALWTAGTPLLAAGLGLDRAPVTVAASLLLLLATVAAAANTMIVFRNA